jgi:flagellin-like protein
MKKKAVSPLIATVLLIAFAVALGAVVINWAGQGMGVTPSKSLDKCSSVKIDLVKLGDSKGVCYTEGEQNMLRFTLKTEGSVPIAKFTLELYNSTQAGVNPYRSVLNEELPSNSKGFVYQYPSSVGNIVLLRITPMIVEGKEEKELSCGSNSIEVNGVPKC